MLITKQEKETVLITKQEKETVLVTKQEKETVLITKQEKETACVYYLMAHYVFNSLHSTQLGAKHAMWCRLSQHNPSCMKNMVCTHKP